MMRWRSISTNENAPSNRGNTACNACSSVSSAGPIRSHSWASSSAMASVSLEMVPGSMPASSTSSAVLTRLPLWPSANWAWTTSRKTGCEFFHMLDPVVEYRVWPMARSPSSAARVRSSNTLDTRPMSLTTVR